MLLVVSCDDKNDNENPPQNETEFESSNETEDKYNTDKFSNPISPKDAPDPFITYDADTGYYYALYTLVDRIELFRHKYAADVLTKGESKVLYRATGKDDVWGDVWAPEMHRGPDGTEVWCAYHGMRYSNKTVMYAPRYCHLQKVEFDETGYPIMGQPIGYRKRIDPPSGEIK